LPYSPQVGRKTLDNVLTIEWAGQKTHLVSPRQSDEYGGAGRGYTQVSEEDDKEERMVSCDCRFGRWSQSVEADENLGLLL